MEQFFTSLISSVVTLVIGFYIGVYKENRRLKNNHDKNIFLAINEILNDQDFMSILNQSESGYLPGNTFSKCDEMCSFISNPANKFISKKLNERFFKFVQSLYNLSHLYSGCSYGGYVNGNRSFKLLLEKTYTDEKSTALLKENRTYSTELEKTYNDFRSQIKIQFYI